MTVSNRRLSLFGCRREPVDETELTTVQIAVASQGVGEGKIGGGGCIAYALFKLGVFRSIDQAKLALDRAGEAIFRRRARVHKPSPYAGLCYPKAKVCVALLAPHHHNHHTHRHPITVSVSLSLHLCACVSLSQVQQSRRRLRWLHTWALVGACCWCAVSTATSLQHSRLPAISRIAA